MEITIRQPALANLQSLVIKLRAKSISDTIGRCVAFTDMVTDLIDEGCIIIVKHKDGKEERLDTLTF